MSKRPLRNFHLIGFAIVRLIAMMVALPTHLAAEPMSTGLVGAEAWGELVMLSHPGEALQAELPSHHRADNIDASCFNVKSNALQNPVMLDYTETDSMNGLLSLWTSQPLEAETKITVVNRCEFSKKSYLVTPDHLATVLPSVAPTRQPAPVKQPVTPQTKQTASAEVTEVNSVPALIAQIKLLEAQLQKLQTEVKTLTQINLTGTQLLKEMRQEFELVRSENQWLRTLTLSLGMTLLASSYFFADWLRRQANQPALANQPVSTPALNASTTTAYHASDFSQQANRFEQSHFGMFEGAQSPAFNQPQYATKASVETPPAQQPPVQNTQVSLSKKNQNALAQTLFRLYRHLQKHPTQSPRIWLYLLDQLKNQSHPELYQQVAEHCRQFFNIKIPSLGTETYASGGLENFPRLCEALQTIWGNPESVAFLHELIFNNRKVPRIGFSREVFEELLLLHDIAAMRFNAMQTQLTEQSSAAVKLENLKRLAQLEDEISAIDEPPASKFQYWSEFIFELDEKSSSRKSA